MSAPFFFRRGTGFTVGEIASLTGGEARSGSDLTRRISGIAALDRAGPANLTFFDNARYAGEAVRTAAGACLTTEHLVSQLPGRVAALCVGAPYLAFIEVARALFPDALRPSSFFEAEGIAPQATVHPTARIESGVIIDPGAVIGAGVEIGSGSVIGAGTVIGAGVRIGRDCSIGANVTISHALIGDRVIVHPGCAIGQDGFGFAPSPNGARKIPQIGRVIIQDDVEIGANSTVDRGALKDTVIGEGTKIDNLVQIAHNVSIGRHCLLAAQVGISGSSVLGDGVTMGGQAGVADHLTIGPGAMVGAQAGLMHDVPAGARWGGTPGRPGKQWLREVATLARLARARAGRDEGAE
jgi:UDP-3-O-[3-hydroxymyristoyl] glucosamine N-acyltransferase